MMAHLLQVKVENESPPETEWSDELECIPLKQRLKLLRANVVSRIRDEILIPAVSSIGDFVKKEDDLCDSLDFHSDHEGSKERSNITSCEQIENGTIHAIVSSPFEEKVFSEKLEIDYNDDEISEEFLEDLDHVVLKERRKMLLSRELVGSVGLAMENNVTDPSTNADATPLTSQHQETTIPESQKCRKSCFSDRKAIKNTLTLPLFPKVKVEPLDDELQISVKDHLDDEISEERENFNNDEIFEDIIDQMLLGDRMRLLASRNFSKTTTYYEDFEDSRVSSSFGSKRKRNLSESSIPILKKRLHKRKKTVTDSVETALEEDAPGLLKVLTEKGVLVDEIKLYGETEADEALDDSLIEESFSELEDVVSKIFFQRQPLFKLAPFRCSKGEKASYCLACLISLVEQVRYLRVRQWPVEWGWCRDLQSFIFVFERQNRIVLERPEYGYATYFFELVDTLPINWQIKRLVTTMKLTSCSRITLIENRPLLVGEDLTEGEARVLMEYGWIPESGLGTMLNYCDRVVHDRKHEGGENSMEWKSKIGKLLTDGYNGGTIVPNDIPKKLMEYGTIGQVKLEEE